MASGRKGTGAKDEEDQVGVSLDEAVQAYANSLPVAGFSPKRSLKRSLPDQDLPCDPPAKMVRTEPSPPFQPRTTPMSPIQKLLRNAINTLFRIGLPTIQQVKDEARRTVNDITPTPNTARSTQPSTRARTEEVQEVALSPRGLRHGTALPESVTPRVASNKDNRVVEAGREGLENLEVD